MEAFTTRGEPLPRAIRHYDLSSTVRQVAFCGWFGGIDHLPWCTNFFLSYNCVWDILYGMLYNVRYFYVFV